MKPNLITKQLQNLLWTSEQSQLFLSKLKHRRLTTSDFLHQAGDICKFEAFVEKGILRSFYKKNEDEEIINQFFFEGQWVSDYQSFITQTPSNVSIQALENCDLFLISKTDIGFLSTQLPNWDSLGKKFFEKLFLKKEKRNASLLLTSAEERYLTILQDQPQLLERIPQYYIAQYIGIKPESLSRIRKKLSKRDTPSF